MQHLHISFPIHADVGSTGPQAHPVSATSIFPKCPCQSMNKDKDDVNLLAYVIITTTFSCI